MDLSKLSRFDKVESLHKCLGVQLFHRQVAKTDYSYIVKQAHNKLTRWRSQNLSFAGNLTLIQSTLFTLPNYVM